MEYRIIAKDGSVKWIEDFGHFVKNDIYGEVFYVFITDKIKESLKEKNEMMSRSVEILSRPLNDILPRTELYWRKC